MSIWCDGELDWERGRNLARHAWQTRDRRRRCLIADEIARAGKVTQRATEED
jgi:hypothetical protein